MDDENTTPPSSADPPPLPPPRPPKRKPRGKRRRLGILAQLNLTTVGTVLALVLSAANLALTPPIITQLWHRPKLEIGGSDNTNLGFSVWNAGNAPATRVEVGFHSERGDALMQVSPNYGSRVIEEARPGGYAEIRVEVDRLLPGEYTRLMIFQKPGTTPADPLKPPRLYVNYIRSSEGPGKVTVRGQESQTKRWFGR